MSKVITATQAAELVKDGSTVAFGGNALQRSPLKMAVHIARSGVKNLSLVKTAIAYEADLLAAAGCMKKLYAGFVGYENEFGLCTNFRKSVESGIVEFEEHACYTVITALRAAAYGVDFLPVKGLDGSDVVAGNNFQKVKSPYSDKEYVAIKAIRPDVAFIHVQKADLDGNGYIIGPEYEDLTIARAAKTLVVTCEEIIDSSQYAKNGRLANISGVLTDYVVHLPGGGHPGFCAGCYEIDSNAVNSFKALKTPEEIRSYLEEAIK